MHTEVTKKIETVTTWTNERTGETVQFESEGKVFYLFNKERITASFTIDEAEWMLKLCDLAVSENKHQLPLQGKDSIPNTSFLSDVLTQFLHKNQTFHNDEEHN